MNDLEKEILEIIQSNYNSFNGTNEAELQSASDINDLVKQQIIKGKIEVLEEIMPTDLEVKKRSCAGYLKFLIGCKIFKLLKQLETPKI